MIKISSRCFRYIAIGLITIGVLIGQSWLSEPLLAQSAPYCQLSANEIAQKDQIRQGALQGNRDAQNRYRSLIQQHAEALRRCRSQSWLKEQAIWLRLYPCDARPGALDEVLDNIVARGYNTVYVETFFDGQVLLPSSDNPTPWSSVLRSPGTENIDLLAQTIQKGRERGMKVYAWMFTMNFGYSYSIRPDRQQVLARNGTGQNSLMVVDDGSQAFVDPYNSLARQDYSTLVEAVARRRPDGMLFDYIRYPRGSGAQSVAGNVRDLWIYGDASRQALLLRTQNNKGRVLVDRYVSRGNITAGDISEVDRLYPNEGAPLWQGRTPDPNEMNATVGARLQRYQFDLWNLTVAHAAQGVVDFLDHATVQARRIGVPAGSVFFPEGNMPVGQRGFDSRLQAWDRFSSTVEWHPMSYAICGTNNASCIADQVQRVLNSASGPTQVIPAIVGLWGRPLNNRPPLEAQMEAIHRRSPQIRSISHFAWSWQEAAADRQRRSCQL